MSRWVGLILVGKILVEKLQADPNEVMNWDIKDAQLDAWPTVVVTHMLHGTGIFTAGRSVFGGF